MGPGGFADGPGMLEDVHAAASAAAPSAAPKALRTDRFL